MKTEGVLTTEQREQFQHDLVLSGIDKSDEGAVIAFIKAWCEEHRIYLDVERLTAPYPW